MHEPNPIRKPDSKHASGLESRLAGALPLSPMSLERQTGVAVNRYHPHPGPQILGCADIGVKLGKLPLYLKEDFMPSMPLGIMGRFYASIPVLYLTGRFYIENFGAYSLVFKLQVPWYISLHFTGFLQEGAISCLILQDHGIWAIINTSLYYRRSNI